jgi:hypothetical protein
LDFGAPAEMSNIGKSYKRHVFACKRLKKKFFFWWANERTKTINTNVPGYIEDCVI